MRLRPKMPRTATASSHPRRTRLIAAALVAAAVFPAAALAASCPLGEKAIERCNKQLRGHDGTDVFALSPNQVLALAKDVGATEPLLRRGFPRYTYAGTLPLRSQLKRAARLGRVYSRAYRADPSDGSLPQEAAFENALLDLERVANAWELPACSVRLAAQ
jgi:hypothetical protein